MSKLQNVFRLLMISTLLINLSTAEEAPKKLDRLINLLNKQVQQKLIGAESAFDTGISRTSEAEESREPEVAMFQVNPARTGVHKEHGPEQLNELLWRFKAEKRFYTPIIHNGTIYIGNHDHHLYAIDCATGKEKWKFKAIAPAFIPTFYNNTIYFGSSNKIFALNALTGKEKWHYDSEEIITTSPLILDDTLYFGCHKGVFYAIDLKTKQKKWKFKSPYNNISVSFAISDELCFFGSGNYLYAINIRDGQEKWTFNLNGTAGSPAVDNGIVYIGAKGFFYAININTSQPKWKYFTVGCYGMNTTPPAITENAIYFGSTDNYAYSLNKETGKLKWDSHCQGQIDSAISISGESVFLGSKKNLYVLDKNTGKEKWKFQTNEPAVSTPIFYKGAVFFSSNNILYAVK
jgi:outer membrane protein assembly factor BamB